MPLVDKLDPASMETLFQRLGGTSERLGHLQRYSYSDIAVNPTIVRMVLGGPRIWFIVTEADGPVGFINYGSFIPGQLNTFGMAVALDFAGRGHAKSALAEFVARHREFNIAELNGFCRADNASMIHIMEATGFRRSHDYRDPSDARTLKFNHPLR